VSSLTYSSAKIVRYFGFRYVWWYNRGVYKRDLTLVSSDLADSVMPYLVLRYGSGLVLDLRVHTHWMAHTSVRSTNVTDIRATATLQMMSSMVERL